MDTQKILKQGAVTVMADYREREIIAHLKSLGAVVDETSLAVGDFVCSDRRVVVERKYHSDFVSSIIDGRLFEQCSQMKENFERPVVIIEGYSDRKIGENALRAAIASLVVDYGASLISTKNSLDTAKTIYWMARREQEENKRPLSIKVEKKPEDENRLQEFVVSSLPGVSDKTSKKILEEFGSIKEFLCSGRERLEKVVGKKKSDKIFSLLNRKYSY